MTRREWLIHGRRGDVCIVRRFDVLDEERVRVVPPSSAARHMDDWFRGWHRSDVLARRQLYDIVDAMEGRLHNGTRIPTRWLKERVEEMLRSGRIVAIRLEHPRYVLAAPPGEAEEKRIQQEAARIRSAEEVIFRVVDDLTERPLAHIKLVIQHPDGSKQAHETDRNGEVRLREDRNVTFKLLKVDLDASGRAEVRDTQNE